MAGNVGLLKHASNVPQTALYLDDVLARGGSRRAVSNAADHVRQVRACCGTRGWPRRR